MTDALTIAREHLAARAREASDTECSECGMRNPPSRPASACGMEFLTHDGCPAAGGAFIPAVSPRGRRQCLGVAESDAVCEAVVALTAEVERLRAELAAAQPVLALDAIRRGPPHPPIPWCAACGGLGYDGDTGAKCSACRGERIVPTPYVPVVPACAVCGTPREAGTGGCPWCAAIADAPDRDLCARCGKLDAGHECEAPRAPGDGTDGA